MRLTKNAIQMNFEVLIQQARNVPEQDRPQSVTLLSINRDTMYGHLLLSEN